jgi:hypothetical protein
MSRRAPEDYDRQVFINCPFDEEYLPLLRAVVLPFMPVAAKRGVPWR